jgi:hypothetical protein
MIEDRMELSSHNELFLNSKEIDEVPRCQAMLLAGTVFD